VPNPIELGLLYFQGLPLIFKPDLIVLLQLTILNLQIDILIYVK